jgi:hypothetical protein
VAEDMTRRRLVLGLCAGAVLLSIVGCGSQRRIESARRVAQSVAEVDLSSATVEPIQTGSLRAVGFVVPGPDSSRWEYRVDTGTGRLIGWVNAVPRDPEREIADFTPERATEIARDTAQRILGSDADPLVWSVASSGPRVIVVRGTAPPLGDPPRTGLGAFVYEVVRSDGVVTSYRQAVPDPGDRDPLPVRVERDEAIATAAADVPEAPGYAREIDAALSQEGGRVLWLVAMSLHPDAGSETETAAPQAVLYCQIDARTGRIVARGVRAPMGDSVVPTAFRRKAEHNDLTRFWNDRWPLMPSLAVAMSAALLAVGSVGLRRSRTRRRASDEDDQGEEEVPWYEAR